LFWRSEVIFAIMQVADRLPDLAAWQLFDDWFRFRNPTKAYSVALPALVCLIRKPMGRLSE
jgi:hypothetical protein